jgi:Anti-sigma-K factor rskA
MGDDERIAYLAGDPGVRLDPAERAELDELSRLLADESLWVEPAGHLQEQIVRAVSAEARGDAATPPDEDGAGTTADNRTAATDSSIAATFPVAEPARHRRRIGYALLGAAAVVLLGIGLFTLTGRDRSRPTEFAASLTGTYLASGATGSATMTQTTSGWRIRLHATGLPRRDNGDYYEAWLKSADGSLVPIGTFNEARDVTLWAGVAPTGYPSITVTQQRAGSGPASSRLVVLSGATHRVR